MIEELSPKARAPTITGYNSAESSRSIPLQTILNEVKTFSIAPGAGTPAPFFMWITVSDPQNTS